jgi:hypothetical protein
MALSGIENHGMETTAFTVATQPVKASPPQGLNQAQTCSMMAASKRWSRMNWQSDALTALKQDVPFFVRPAVRRRVESMAVEAGRTDVCLDFYREAKASMGPK